MEIHWTFIAYQIIQVENIPVNYSFPFIIYVIILRCALQRCTSIYYRLVAKQKYERPKSFTETCIKSRTVTYLLQFYFYFTSIVASYNSNHHTIDHPIRIVLYTVKDESFSIKIPFVWKRGGEKGAVMYPHRSI